MPGPATLMRELHRMRVHARDLQEALDRLPRQLRAQQGKVAAREETFKEAQETLRRLKVTVLEKESQLRTTHQQINKYEKQLEDIESKKEYDALQLEITHARELVTQLEEEILSGIAETEERTAQLPELEKAVTQAREEFAQFEAQQRERQESLNQQLAQVQNEIVETEKQIPIDARGPYERVVKAKGPDGLAAVRGTSCGACSTTLTAQNMQELNWQHLVLCPSCGRILYLAE
jgi:predicted  nucleic acid-binding Zn-ribbon protein